MILAIDCVWVKNGFHTRPFFIVTLVSWLNDTVFRIPFWSISSYLHPTLMILYGLTRRD